jgi:hypothetical protein
VWVRERERRERVRGVQSCESETAERTSEQHLNMAVSGSKIERGFEVYSGRVRSRTSGQQHL